MARSANRQTYPVATPRTDTQTLYAHFTGAAASDCTFDAQEALNGEITALTHSSTGVYAGTLRFVYPELKGAPIISSRAEGTAGIFGKVTAIDVTAGTFTLKTYVGNTLTDLATTDTLDMTWSVRNSGKNK
jgi:hypothetical protein